jgi:hypothetical protein
LQQILVVRFQLLGNFVKFNQHLLGVCFSKCIQFAIVATCDQLDCN